jgi:hypothetical protein
MIINPYRFASAGLAITRIFNASAQTTSASFGGTATAGDLIIVMAHRDGSTTPPTKVTGYTTIDNTTGASTNSAILAFKFSDGTETGTGTWTNATSVTTLVYRNAGLGGWAKTRTAGTTSPMTYGTLSMQNTSGSSWVAGLGATKGSTDVGTNAPSGMTVRTSATDIAAFDTGAGVASWSAQTAAVNGTPGGTISYTLELMAIPANGTLFTLIQFANVNGAASGTTAAITLGQSVGSEPHILLVSHQYSANPVAVTAIDKGGTLVPIVSTEGGGPDATGNSMGYVIGTTTATTPLTVTFSGTTGGCDVAVWEVAYLGAAPTLDVANKVYDNTSTTTPANPTFTLSAAQTAIFSAITTTNNTTAIANPFNSPTGNAQILSGNGWACALNQTSGTGAQWTISASGTSIMSAAAFGPSPTAFSTLSITDFEGSSNGTSVTEALLHAAEKGWGIGRWGFTGTAMKFATAASQPLLTSISRLNNGTSFASGAGSLGVQYLTSTGTSYIKQDLYPTNGAATSTAFSAGVWFYSDIPGSDASNLDVFTLYAAGGANFANAKFLQNGGGNSRTFQLEVAGGGGTSSVNVSPSTWYWLNLQYNKTGQHHLKIYAADGTTVIGTIDETSNGVGTVQYVAIGHAAAGVPTTGYLINFDSLKVDPAGTYPLLP